MYPWGVLLLLPLAFAAAPPSIDKPLRTKEPAASDAAVVIGNHDYSDLPDVPYADRDADAFADWLLYSRGVPEARVHRLENESNFGMRDAIVAASAEVEPGGVLWVYYAGHGIGLQNDATGKPERGLVGARAEGDYRRMPEYVLRISDIERSVGSTRAERVVVVLDACYTNTGRDGDAVFEGRPAIPVGWDPTGGRLTVLSAAAPDEVALPYKPARHGLFTWALIGALRGWADGELGEADGQVDLAEVSAWVKGTVATVSRERQNPAAEKPMPLVLGAALEDAPAVDRLPQLSDERTNRRWVMTAGGGVLLAAGAGLLGAGLLEERALQGNDVLLREWDATGESADTVAQQPEVAAVNRLYIAGYSLAGGGLGLGLVGLSVPIAADGVAGVPVLRIGGRW